MAEPYAPCPGDRCRRIPFVRARAWASTSADGASASRSAIASRHAGPAARRARRRAATQRGARGGGDRAARRRRRRARRHRRRPAAPARRVAERADARGAGVRRGAAGARDACRSTLQDERLTSVEAESRLARPRPRLAQPQEEARRRGRGHHPAGLPGPEGGAPARSRKPGLGMIRRLFLLAVTVAALGAGAWWFLHDPRCPNRTRATRAPSSSSRSPRATARVPSRGSWWRPASSATQWTFRARALASGRGTAAEGRRVPVRPPADAARSSTSSRAATVFLRQVTFPEGLTIREMAGIYESHGLGTAASFVDAAARRLR